MITEEWLPVKGFDGIYEISNFGNLKSLNYKGKKGNNKVLSPCNSHGYRSLILCKNKTKLKCDLHRLVAQAFIPNPENKPCVNHKNGIRNDNRVENLEWCTYRENNIHSHYVLGNESGKNKKKVLMLSKNGEFIKEYSSISLAAYEMNLDQGNISRVCLGIKKTSGGFKWKYS